MKNYQQAKIIVSGKVQKVGFRFFTIGLAKNLGLRGWVRNRKNGNVEIMVEGDKLIIDKFLSSLSLGPSSGRVDNLKIEYFPFTDSFKKFTTKLTK